MDDPAESDPARPAPRDAQMPTGGDAPGAHPLRRAGDAPSPAADGLGFRLRIGGQERPRLGQRTDDAARPVTDELPAIGASTPAGGPPAGGDLVSGEVAVVRDEWDGLPESVRQDEVREYRTDLDVQRFIADLANQIAASDGGAASATDAPADGTRARAKAGAVAPKPVASSPKAAGKATAPGTKPGATKPGATKPGATKQAATRGTSAPSPAPEPAVAAASSTAVAVTDDEHPGAAIAVATVDEPVAPVEIPAIVEAAPAQIVTGQQPVVPTIAAAPVLTPVVPTVAPVLPAAQLVPKIEAVPGAPRPTRPVDFRSLLGDAGMPPVATGKRKRQRRPVRFLLKLVLVLALLGGGAYAAKRYYLDVRWASDVEGIADDVAARRGLSWDDAVKVVVLDRNEYALHLASTMLGVDIAQAATLGGEWRAMGIAQGSLDLVAVGAGALPDRPAFYDPIDGNVYQVADLSPELREIALSRALASALLDQHFHWGQAIEGASPSVRLGILALFDGDALAVETSTVAAVLADETLAATATADLGELRLETAPLASGAPPFAVAMAGHAGVVTQPQFSGELALNPVGRNAVLDLAVPSDAAIFDGARGRSAAVALPDQATTTIADGVTATTADAAPGATAPIGVIGAASGAAAQTEEAIQQTMGAAAEVTGTAVDPAGTTIAGPAGPVAPGDASASSLASDVATATTVPVAPASASPRGLVYWYYALASRIDADRAWTAALQWQGDLTSVEVSAEGLCVSSIVRTADAAGRDVLLGALQEWAAAAPAAAGTTVAPNGDTEITVHSCDPGPTATTMDHTDVPLFGHADEEQIVATGLQSEGLPRSEAARACVFRAVREIGLPALLESKTLDRSLTQRTLDPTAAEIPTLIARCGNE